MTLDRQKPVEVIMKYMYYILLYPLYSTVYLGQLSCCQMWIFSLSSFKCLFQTRPFWGGGGGAHFLVSRKGPHYLGLNVAKLAQGSSLDTLMNSIVKSVTLSWNYTLLPQVLCSAFLWDLLGGRTMRDKGSVSVFRFRVCDRIELY